MLFSHQVGIIKSAVNMCGQSRIVNDAFKRVYHTLGHLGNQTWMGLVILRYFTRVPVQYTSHVIQITEIPA